MKYLFLSMLIVGIMTNFSSCKKKFTCECTNYTTSEVSSYTVKARKEAIAAIECMNKYSTSDKLCIIK